MNNESNNTKYIELPMIVLQDENISSTTKLLMGVIISLSMKDGFCFASNKYLGSIMNTSRRTITKCISSLKSKNYIEIKNDTNNDSFTRKIYIAKIF